MSSSKSLPNKKKKTATVLLFVGLFALIAIGSIGFVAVNSLRGANKAKEAEFKRNTSTVEVGDIRVEVIESGPLEAQKSVEVKSRVSGRVQQLLVDEGDMVTEGQLIAIIDPQETELQVKQNQAQLRGAQAGVSRLSVEIAQREVTARTNLARAQSRLRQVQLELREQPGLTNAGIRSAQAALASAEQGLALLVRVTQPNTKIQIQSSLDEAKANLQNSQLEFDRRKSLLEQGYISKREFEQAELNLQLARTRIQTSEDRLERLNREQDLERKQAEERVNQAKEELNRVRLNSIQDTVKKEEYRRAQQDVMDATAALKDVQALAASRAQQAASVDQLQSVLGDSMRQLGETEIRAPVTGIVTQRLVQLGELVASLSSFSSGTPIIKIEDRATMKVKLDINEIDVAKLKMGMKAEVKVDAFPDRSFNGKVTKVAPASAPTTAATGANPVVKYTVEVTLDSGSPDLKSGMSAQCTMRVLDRTQVVRILRSFVVTDQDGTTSVLLLKNKDARDAKGQPVTEKTKVSLGASSGAYIEVLSGVKKGDLLYKPEFSGPGRKTFFVDGDEAERAREKEAEEQGKEVEPAPGSEGEPGGNAEASQ